MIDTRLEKIGFEWMLPQIEAAVQAWVEVMAMK
jgi:hypothetical protein